MYHNISQWNSKLKKTEGPPCCYFMLSKTVGLSNRCTHFERRSVNCERYRSVSGNYKRYFKYLWTRYSVLISPMHIFQLSVKWLRVPYLCQVIQRTVEVKYRLSLGPCFRRVPVAIATWKDLWARTRTRPVATTRGLVGDPEVRSVEEVLPSPYCHPGYLHLYRPPIQGTSFLFFTILKFFILYPFHIASLYHLCANQCAHNLSTLVWDQKMTATNDNKLSSFCTSVSADL
jgi:hypothetical protein